MRLVLLRHGRTGANEQRLYCGWTDIPLSEGGRKQLQERQAEVSYPDTAGMLRISSGMRRADETMDILFCLAPQRREEELREMNFGSFEMHSYAELKEDDAYQAWICDAEGKVCTPGGESNAQFAARVKRALDGLVEGGEDALIVCHGGVIAAIMQQLFPEEGKNMYQWQPDFGLGYEIAWTDGRWKYMKIE